MRPVPRSSIFVFFLVVFLLPACSSDDGGGGPIVEPPVDLAPISDLMVTAGSSSSVTLSWTSPQALNKAPNIVYDLRHTGYTNSEADWETWDVATPPAADAASGVARTFEVTGLTGGATYAFDLRASDGGEDWSGGSNLVLATAAEVFDTLRPAAVTDLRQWSGTATSLTFGWTAAGDDSLYGMASAHELRYSIAPITAENWAQASVAPGAPTAGEVEGMLEQTISGLDGETMYYAAVVAEDDQGQASALSNVVAAETGDLSVIRVYVDGSGDYPTIERAIGAAQVGDLILVGPGRYTWTNQGTGDPLHGMINVPRDWTDFEVRSMAGAEQTILDAEGNGAVMSVTGGFEVLGDGSLNYAGITIDGFTFTGGAANGEEASSVMGWAGGGINLHLSDSIIRNCIFRENEANQGGAVWIGGQGDAILEDCLIEDNEANAGGGVMLINSEPRITVRRCTIRDNYARHAGGGLLAYHCTMTVEDCLITANRTNGTGGGISMTALFPFDDNLMDDEVLGQAEIVGCTIAGNSAPSSGSGLYMSIDSVPLVERTAIAFNGPARGLSGVANSWVEIGCSLIFGNEGGDNLPFASVDLGGNLNEDPLFCDLVGFQPGAGSPLLPEGSGECGLIGAVGQGCFGP